jgi:hypothetical protein
MPLTCHAKVSVAGTWSLHTGVFIEAAAALGRPYICT